MPPMTTPADLIALSIKTSIMLAQANMVITMRMLGLMGMWRVLPTENTRMSSEKMTAARHSGQAMVRATLQGKSPAKVAEAGLRPVARVTRANAKRLAARGPGAPA
ncbi:MAG: antifreeze protein [Paracoccaceae bacterium]|nr:MAG: antifreeze protein [Paracoccaceae bacterium]